MLLKHPFVEKASSPETVEIVQHWLQSLHAPDDAPVHDTS
jgi:hypothetical protein